MSAAVRIRSTRACPRPTRACPRPSLLARALMGLVRAYQLVPKVESAVPRCRFLPSCSAYALESLRRHGAFRGVWLTVRRLLRCHPFNPGGFDEVPPPAGADTDGHTDPHWERT